MGANTYEQLLARLGHKLVLTRQIHVQDSYTRLGRGESVWLEQCLAQALQLGAANPLDYLNAILRTLHGGRD
ncbi:MAG: hypothetical protein ACLQM8_23235 [Limisphaerales bacterium]